ncbi:preprotein translocase subunit SecG [Candidatus Poribacteria bacterium]|nr:MAG: preprotein translocase subunit SecG [Candidatus Poribacteria bacterium]
MGIIMGFVLFLFVPICVVLTLIILLQDSKGEGLSSSAFGGAEMQSVLGGRGAATFLSKLTTWLAIAFMVVSLFLMRFYGEGTGGALAPIEQETTQEGAAEPADTTSEGTVETTTDGDSADDAQDASKTEIDGGTTDTTE